ncbi:cold-shock protein [Nitriliruptor sp.]|uniref:cold-shock protein n=1 Tax=Nitriliruptor sp. TaxID=2448056 RepID=UPI0034A08CE7
MTEDPQLQHLTSEIAIQPGPDARRSGVVRWYSEEKGYGFLAPDDGSEDVFVRYSAIEGDGFRSLREGQAVTFVTGSDGRGPRASEVRPS